MEIRRLDAGTASGAAELFREARRSVVTTATHLMHRDQTMPERARRLSLVALDGDVMAGYGSAHLGWEGGTTGAARVWVRGQGLARLAKLYTIDWAEHGIREILTASDEDNVAMLELNRSLGYRQLWRRQSFERQL